MASPGTHGQSLMMGRELRCLHLLSALGFRTAEENTAPNLAARSGSLSPEEFSRS